jgi:hypothetical protein
MYVKRYQTGQRRTDFEENQTIIPNLSGVYLSPGSCQVFDGFFDNQSI